MFIGLILKEHASCRCKTIRTLKIIWALMQAVVLHQSYSCKLFGRELLTTTKIGARSMERL